MDRRSELPLDRDQVQVRLIARFPGLPAGVVLAAVGQSRPSRGHPDHPPLTWLQVEAVAEEGLLLRAAMTARQPPPLRP